MNGESLLKQTITEAPATPSRRARAPIDRGYLARAALILAAAAAARWALMLRFYLHANSDQAIVGLMARHALSGEYTAFYWGQDYNGTLETILTASAFRLLGQSELWLHLAPILFSLLFVAAAMALCRALYGNRPALFCGATLICPPPVLLAFSVWPSYNYLQTMALGTTALTLALPLARGASWVRLPVAAALLGLALWAQPLATVYLPALLAATLGPAIGAWQRGQRRELALALIATLAALALALWPALAYNLHTDWATLRFLISRPEHAGLGLGERLRRVALWAGPTLLGPIPPNSDPGLFDRYLRTHPVRYALSLAVLLAGAGWALGHGRVALRWLRTTASTRPAPELPLLVLGLTVLAAYLFSTWSSSRWSATEPRYLLPLYTLTPLLAGALWRVPAPARTCPPAGARTSGFGHTEPDRRDRASIGARAAAGAGRRVPGTAPRGYPVWCSWLALATLALTALTANGGATQLRDQRPLAALLARRGDRAVYGDYWLVYRLAFLSGERLIPVAALPDRRPALNRYPPYLARAAGTARISWVVPAGGAAERSLRQCLAARRLRYARVLLSDGPMAGRETLAIYDRFSAPACRLLP